MVVTMLHVNISVISVMYQYQVSLFCI